MTPPTWKSGSNAAPLLTFGLPKILGLRPQGVSSLDEHWANLEAATGLKPEAFLTSPQNQIEELKERLKGPPAALPIEARSPAEVIDFVAAVSRGSSECDALSARALIVEQRGAWKAIAASGSKLLLIVHPSLPAEPELVAEAVRQGHHVLLSSNQQAREGADQHTFAKSLPPRPRTSPDLVGFRPAESHEIRAGIGRKLDGAEAFARTFSRHDAAGMEPNARCRESGASSLGRRLGGGVGRGPIRPSKTRESAVQRSFGCSRAVVEHLRLAGDVACCRVGASSLATTRGIFWPRASAPTICDGLKKLPWKCWARTIPPTNCRPTSVGWPASTKRFSPTRKPCATGLAETLALLAAKPERVLGAVNLPGRVDYIVRTLLKGKNWRRWASLSHQLPVLAEAAPEAFLEAADHDLGTKEPALVKLFEQEGQAFLSSSPHPGLLWALEGLAWEPTYLRKVSEILARLAELDPAELDPKGRLGNRPMRSLEEIFVPWHPQTTGTVEERVKVLRILAGRERNVGWRCSSASYPTSASLLPPLIVRRGETGRWVGRRE